VGGRGPRSVEGRQIREPSAEGDPKGGRSAAVGSRIWRASSDLPRGPRPASAAQRSAQASPEGRRSRRPRQAQRAGVPGGAPEPWVVGAPDLSRVDRCVNRAPKATQRAAAPRPSVRGSGGRRQIFPGGPARQAQRSGARRRPRQGRRSRGARQAQRSGARRRPRQGRRSRGARQAQRSGARRRPRRGAGVVGRRGPGISKGTTDPRRERRRRPEGRRLAAVSSWIWRAFRDLPGAPPRKGPRARAAGRKACVVVGGRARGAGGRPLRGRFPGRGRRQPFATRNGARLRDPGGHPVPLAAGAPKKRR